LTRTSAVEAFRLDAERGQRFAIYRPACLPAPRGAILYAHPFGEEMNKSRRTAAMQARAFAAAGFAVLQLDLYGCGDSDGDFADARWDIWKLDLERATEWLERRVTAPIHLWGLRLGATLALSLWRDAPSRYRSALLWQPVIDGRAYVTQFLRVAIARHAMRGGGPRPTTERLREAFSRREALEIAGYVLSSELASAIEAQALGEWSIPGARVHWIDIRAAGADSGAKVPDVVSRWRANDVDVEYRVVESPNFWTSIEVIEAPEVVAVTTSVYTSGAAGGRPAVRAT
jgi:exosortase A-associated hydrolase 2